MNKLIAAAFTPLYGKPCWGIRFCRATNLSLNFGQPYLSIREPVATSSTSEAVQKLAATRTVSVRGEWWLWLQCYWQLSSHNDRLATGSSSQTRIEKALRQLDGQKLLAVEVDPTTGASCFGFDLGCVLRCRRFERNSDEVWLLYKPNGYVLAVLGDGSVTHEREDKRPS
jgi:hypothetical protein